MISEGMRFLLIYIGPGMAGGVFAAIIGVLTAFVLFLVAIIWYPIKKLIHYFRSQSQKQ